MDDDRLVQQILDATQDMRLWERALRSTLERFNGDMCCAFFVGPDETLTFIDSDNIPVKEELVAEGWHERNPRMVRGLDFARRNQSHLFTDWRMFTPEEIARSEFEQDFAIRHRCTHFAGTVFSLQNGSYFVVSLERGPSKGAFHSDELQRFERFLKRIGTPIRYAFKTQSAMLCGMVDALAGSEDRAHAWLSSRGKINHASPGFAAILGRYINDRDGHILAFGEDDAKLQWLLADCAAGRQSNQAVLLRNPTKPADMAIARAIPLRTIMRDTWIASDVLLSIEPMQRNANNWDTILRQRHGLTSAETKLVVLLTEGNSLRATAEALQITYETARTQLKVAFQKTGTSRQIELVLLVRGLSQSTITTIR